MSVNRKVEVPLGNSVAAGMALHLRALAGKGLGAGSGSPPMRSGSGRAHSRAMQADHSTPEEETAMTQLDPTGTLEELDFRENAGIAVSLLWHRSSGRLSVLVEDARLGKRFTLPARRDNARDVFDHPYAYAQPIAA